MRRRSVLALAAASTIVGLAIGNAGQAAPAIVTLNGKVGPGYTIGLKKGGKKVTSLMQGRKRFVIRDQASVHNFHLTGPGVNKKTSLTRVATVTWTLTLARGTYRFVCDNHPGLAGSFRVT
jgi:hypothetical protein